MKKTSNVQSILDYIVELFKDNWTLGNYNKTKNNFLKYLDLIPEKSLHNIKLNQKYALLFEKLPNIQKVRLSEDLSKKVKIIEKKGIRFFGKKPPILRPSVKRYKTRGDYISESGMCNLLRYLGVSIISQDAVILYNKGNALSELGRYIEAIECYDKALEINERDASIWYNKGIALSKLGRYEDALVCFNEALKIDERDAFVWNNKGTTLSELERYEEAIEYYDRALNFNEKDAAVWYNKACFESLRNNKQESIQFLKKAIELDDGYIDKTKLDSDFDNIRDSNEFKGLIE